MAKSFESGLGEAVVGLIFGFVVQLAVIPMLIALKSPWYVWLLVIVVVGLDLITSIVASFSGGIGFAAAFILVGWAMGDLETMGLGLLALVGCVGGLLRKRNDK